MSPSVANFLFELANVSLLALGLAWVFFAPVRRALDAERARHEEAERETARLREEAASAAERARSAQGAAERELERRRAEILAAARAEAQRMVEDARRGEEASRSALARELEAARRAQTEAVIEDVARIVAESVRRLLVTLQGPALDVALVRAACEPLRVLPLTARRAAFVESARALPSDATRLLEEALGAAPEVRVVAELGAGVRITTPAGQIDASASSVVREAARAAHAALEASRPERGFDDG